MADPLKLTEFDLLPQWAKGPMPAAGAPVPFGSEDLAEKLHPSREEREEPRQRREFWEQDRRGPARGGRYERGRGEGEAGPTRPFRGKKGNRAQGHGSAASHGGPLRTEVVDPPPLAPPPDLGVEVLFVPDPHGAESMARQIRSTCLAYPVFDLAKVALKKEARHQVVLRKKEGATQQLYRCTLDGTVWLERAAGADHVVEHHLDVFYAEEQEPCDPPKGNFTALGVCSLDGTVLGPVNHHDYGPNLRRLHQKKFARMPFEEFKNKIQVLRDPEKIEAWRQAQAVRVVYVPRPEPFLNATRSVLAAAATETQAESVVEAEPGSQTGSAPGQTESASEPATARAPAEPSSEVSASEDRGEAEQTVSPAAGEASISPAGGAVRLRTLAEVREHFLLNHAEAFLNPVEEVVLETLESRRDSAPELAEQIRYALQEELRFPLKTAKALIRQLGRFGLQFFKWGRGATFVSGIRPKRFDSDPAALTDGVRAVYEWVLAHPQGRREQLFKAMAKQVAAVPGGPKAEVPASDPGAEGSAVSSVSQQTSPMAPLPPPGAIDLLWLVKEGFVVAFANGRLDLIRTPPKKNDSAPKPERGKVAVVSVGPEEVEPSGSGEGEERVASGPAQVDPPPADPSDDPEAERGPERDDPL